MSTSNATKDVKSRGDNSSIISQYVVLLKTRFPEGVPITPTQMLIVRGLEVVNGISGLDKVIEEMSARRISRQTIRLHLSRLYHQLGVPAKSLGYLQARSLLVEAKKSGLFYEMDKRITIRENPSVPRTDGNEMPVSDKENG